MSSVNKVTLVGNLGRDPEIKTFQNGGRIANLRIATSEFWRDKTSKERREKTEWHSVVVSSEPIIKFIDGRLKKGHKVYIEGKLETRSYEAKDGSGKKTYVTEVVVRPYAGELKLLDRPANSNRAGSGEPEQDHGGHEESQHQGGSGNVGLDDDIPF